jgi:molybdopterin converting factor small subunit
VKIAVRYFASLVDRTGVATETVEIDPAADVARLWDRVREIHPRLADVTIRPLAACDLEYASWDRKLDGVAEVAFLPPVSGG